MSDKWIVSFATRSKIDRMQYHHVRTITMHPALFFSTATYGGMASLISINSAIRVPDELADIPDLDLMDGPKNDGFPGLF